MALQITDLNVAPFYDDYDSTKNFHRILFRPRSVQARELNQAQTILQEQINRMGRNLFEEGAAVIPGGISVKMSQNTIKVNFQGVTDYNAINANTANLLIKSKTSNLTAKVIKVIPATDNEQACVALDYIRSANDNTTKFFQGGESIVIYFIDGSGNEIPMANVNVVSAHLGIYVKALSGIYFVRGHLVQAYDSDVIAAKFDNQGSVRVGFKVSESIVDENQDASLFSNAIGTPNWKAPGAARLKFDLQLTSVNFDVADPSFVEIVRIKDGILQKKVTTTDYALIEKTLAQRTYEESGDYVVNQFPLNCVDHLRSANSPDGVYTADKGGDASKYIARLKPGIAYVKGYRVENISILDIPADKARDTIDVNNGAAPAAYGSYILVNNVKSQPVIGTQYLYQFLAGDGTTLVGNFRVRASKVDGSNQRLYVHDISFQPGKSSADVKKIKYTDSLNLFTADVSGGVLSIFDGGKDSLLFPLNYGSIKTMLSQGGVSDTTYQVSRSYDVTTNASGVATISLTANETFAAVTPYDYAVAKGGVANDGTQYPVSSITLSGTPLGRALTVTIAGLANTQLKVLTTVIKLAPAQKTKTLKTLTETLLVKAGSNKIQLTKADIYGLNFVVNKTSGQDVAAGCSYWDGQRSNWYEPGIVTLPSAVNADTQFDVTYRYFDHSAGDYFSVDSYSGLSRESVPTINHTANRAIVHPFDCLDFRPLKSTDGTFAGYVGEIVQPNDTLRFDLSYYTNRMDAVYVSADGTFGIQKGISGDKPSPASVPDNAMKLYDLWVPAYTADVSKIRIAEIDNRRYTMRDIGGLEKRIQNIEYYTTLNMLELKADRTQVFDSSGNARFKNGFAVDGFNGFQMADIMDADWEAAIDFDRNRLVAPFSDQASPLNFNQTSSDGNVVVVPGNVAMLKWTDVVEINQMIATRTSNINPYAVFTWAGSVTLNPTTDFWVDTKYNPPIIVNQTFDLTGGARAGTTTAQQVATSTWNRGLSWGAFDTYRTTTTTTTFTQTDIVTDFASKSKDEYVNTQILPFMRPIDINFTLRGFRPFTRVYPFFESVDVSSVCNQTGNNKGTPIVTDAAGYATGVFSVPSSPTFRFRTGKGVLRFTDSPVDSRAITDFTTDGEAVFNSGGEQINRQVTVTNTTTIRATTKTWQTTNKTDQLISSFRPNQGGGGGGRGRGGDPIAQSFMISQSGGCFLTGIGVFFSTKAANLPVKLQLRSMENGLPTNEVMPFGEVVLTPSQVSVSADASAETVFRFACPIYIEENTEYCVVLLADTQEYNCYIARMGENIIGKPMALSKQANLGVFFTSSNGSSWNPSQMDDLTFKVYRAQFPVGNFNAVFNGSAPKAEPMIFNPIATVNGNKTVTITHRNHGYNVGDQATFANIPAGNGNAAIASVVLTVQSVIDMDTFTVNLPVAANATGTYGGSGMTLIPNVPFVNFNSSLNQLAVTGTSVNWSMQYWDAAGRGLQPSMKLIPGKSTDLKVRGIETINLQNIITASLGTTKANLTPMVDLEGGLMLVDRRINNVSDPKLAAYNYVSRSIRFDNPSTSARIWVGAKLPGSTTMRVYYKLIKTGSEDLTNATWVELSPVRPLANSDNSFTEFEYQLNNVGTFVGYKLCVMFQGNDPTSTPELCDIRTISLA